MKPLACVIWGVSCHPHALLETHIISIIQVIDCRFNWLIRLGSVSGWFHWLRLQTSVLIFRRRGTSGRRCCCRRRWTWWHIGRILFGWYGDVELVFDSLLFVIFMYIKYVHGNNRKIKWKHHRKLKYVAESFISAIFWWQFVFLVCVGGCDESFVENIFSLRSEWLIKKLLFLATSHHETVWVLATNSLRPRMNEILQN